MTALLAELPTGLLIGLTVLTVTVSGASELSEAPLRQPVVALVLTVLVVSLVAVTTLWLSDESEPSLGWIGFIPTGWMVGLALAGLLIGRTDRIEWFLGGDNVRHMAFVAEIVDAGLVDYSENVYPRAWHGGLALVWLNGNKTIDEESLSAFVSYNATAAWVLFAALVLATSNLAATLAGRLVPGRVGIATVSAFVAGFAIMTPRFLADTMALGFQTSLLAAVALAVVGRECVLDRDHRFKGFLVFMSLTVLMSHTWQLLIPAVAMPAAISAWQLVRAGGRTRAVALAVAVAGVIASLTPVLAVATGLGPAATAADGVVAAPNWPILTASLLGIIFVLRAFTTRTAVAVGAVAILPVIAAAAISGGAGVPITAYYPAKLLWHTAAIGLSFLVALGVKGYVNASRGDFAARFGRAVLGVGAVCVVAVGLVTPFGSQVHVWSTVDATRVLAVTTTPGASEAHGAWMGTPTESAVTRTLIATLRGEQLAKDRLTLAEECRALRAAARPTVVTTHTTVSARRKYDCVDRLVVLTAQRDSRGESLQRSVHRRRQPVLVERHEREP